jgi:hypothetical protein
MVHGYCVPLSLELSVAESSKRTRFTKPRGEGQQVIHHDWGKAEMGNVSLGK